MNRLLCLMNRLLCLMNRFLCLMNRLLNRSLMNRYRCNGRVRTLTLG
jgi:hypothetical protein